MDVKKTEIHIALAFDQNFIIPFHVLLTSIFYNNKENLICLHIIATGINNNEIDIIKNYVALNNGKINFYDISKIYDLESINNPNLKLNNFTVATFYRLFFPALISRNIKKLLYLDVDTVVLGDLKKLYLTDIKSFVIGAVNDVGMLQVDFPFMEEMGLDKKRYFNAGVLIINTDEWIRQDISLKVLTFISDYQNNLKFWDQDALNFVLKENWFQIDKVNNFCATDISINLTKKEIIDNNKFIILHYTSSKPWHLTNSARLRSYYYHYLKKSSYINKKKYSDFSWTKASFKKYLYIRLLEFYLDSQWIRATWNRLKSQPS